MMHDPTLTAARALAETPGPVFFDSMTGNNGDDLIRMGCEHAIAQAGLERVSTPEDAATIVITGGGGMVDFSATGLQTLRNHLERFPQTPLVVLPQSYLFEHTDFGAFFEGRTAPVSLLARERISLDILEQIEFPPSVRFGIDHDMAFQLRDSELVKRWRSRTSDDHVLIVERADAESVTGATDKPMGYRPLNRFVPSGLKVKIKRMLRARRDRDQAERTAFAIEMRERSGELYPQSRSLPVVAGDISSPDRASFDGFCETIARSAVVCTNRLHVGVFAAMLGKPTLLRSGSYHKIRGIYAYSLADDGDVHLVDDPG